MSRVFSNSYTYITTAKQAKSYASGLLKDLPDIVGVDTETTGLNYLDDKLKLVQIAAIGKPVHIFDIDKIGVKGIEALNDVLNSTVVKIFHNGKFDLKFLNMIGITINANVFDTMLAEQVIMSGSVLSGFSLKDITMKYTDIVLDKEFQKSNHGFSRN